MLPAYFKNTSISKKLYFSVGIMAFLIIVELCALSFALSTLSAIRAFVGGEGLWSKAQKDATQHLRLYAYSGNEDDYYSFQHYLKVPLGDGKARVALEKPEPDISSARQGLLEGRNHPNDIDGMIKLMLRFHDNAYLAQTIHYWTLAENSLKKLIPLANQLHQATRAGTLTEAQKNIFRNKINQINDEITPMEDGFSFTLGEGSRWLENWVLRILVSLALTVEVTGILIAVSVSRSIQKGLSAVVSVAERMAKGLLDRRVQVYSSDEIGRLATAFNTMAGHLDGTVSQLQDSETRLRSFFESSRACHVLLDKELNISAFNKPAVEFARKHCNLELKQGIPAHQWVQTDRLLSFMTHCEMAMEGQLVEIETKIIYSNGENIWWSLIFEGACNTAGEVIGVSYHATDITRRVQQEQEIKAQNETLKQIAFIQSHEMRRPVASILGLINIFEVEDYVVTKDELLLLKKATEELDAQIHKIVDDINFKTV
ncbi:HAMP domain-containing protein [Mucilaginibacter robiniae]|uniref:histidine kinase n=1 Tax=Mucilaginibacter robiniae TaxID=2728022 RepID=A0A7L5E3P9_9SPHI|nr:HAMP domain-containing protein [Mucilaginibacter robiniae]QJD97661.1 HAMP domain-containing protein [Mucilaginibacter robiniae]